MAHDVFISYSSKDEGIANAVCSTLEDRKIRCWIAHRDERVGEKWSKAITQAIDDCQIMVLVFSSSADASEQVERELVVAAKRGKIILPLRVEATEPSGTFAYHLENLHWHNAMTPPLEKHLNTLAERITLLFDGQPQRNVPDIKPTWLLSLSAPNNSVWANLVKSSVRSVAFSPSGNLLATGSGDITKLWSTSSGELLTTLTGHSNSIRSVAFSPDGRLLATGSRDKTAKLWDADSSKLITTFNGHSGIVTSVAFSPDGKHLVAGSYDSTVKLWDVDSGKLLLKLTGHFGQSFFALSVAFSPDGKLLATGCSDNTAKLYDTDSGNRPPTPTGKFYAIITGKLLDIITGHTGIINSIAFSPDGKMLATGSFDNTAKLWDADNRECLTTFHHTDTVYCVAFSPDGKLLATGSLDNTAKLWDTESGKCLATLPGYRVSVNSVAFSPDGKLLALGSDGNTTEVWKIR